MRFIVSLLLLVACSPAPLSSSDGGFLLPLPEQPGGQAGGAGGGQTAGGVGGGSSADAGAQPTGRGVCTDTVVFPQTLGDACGAGSNLPLCVVRSQSTCGVGTVCVWDQAAASTPRAYCTVGCSPGDVASCPSGYQCQQQGCSNGPQTICVRRAESTCTRVAEFGTGRVAISTLIPALDATAVGVQDGSTLKVFLMRGTTVVRDLGAVADSRFTAKALGAFGREAWWSASPRLIRITETMVETFTVPDINEFGLAASNGTTLSFYGATTSTRRPAIATFQGGVVSGGEATSTITDQFSSALLTDGTVVGPCAGAASRSTVCLTRDFVTASQLALPDGGVMPDRDWSIIGASATDLMLVTADATILRYRDGRWVSDLFPRGDAKAFLQQIGDLHYVTRVGVADGGVAPRALFLETPGCWKPLPTGVSVYEESTPTRHGYYSSGQTWCEVPLPR